MSDTPRTDELWLDIYPHDAASDQRLDRVLMFARQLERELAEAKREGERYLELKRQIRAVGKMIPCTTGGTFENDPPDAIVDACRRENESLRIELDTLLVDKERWKNLVTKAQAILTDNLVPDGISNSECINRLLELLDGPEYRAAIDAARKENKT